MKRALAIIALGIFVWVGWEARLDAQGQPTVQWQAVINLINNIQAQLNKIQASLPPTPSPGTAGDVLGVNGAGSAYSLFPLSGDLVCSTSNPGSCKVIGFYGLPLIAGVPSVGQEYAWNGTGWALTADVPAGNVNNLLNVMAAPYNAQCVGASFDDGPAFRAWDAAMCANNRGGLIPASTGGCWIQSTDSNNVGWRHACDTPVYGQGIQLGKPGPGNGIGAAHATNATPLNYLSGTFVFCTQTSGICVEVAYPGPSLGQPPPANFGTFKDFGIVGLGTDGATLNLSSISATTNGSGAGNGAMVTGTTSTPIGLPIGSETGVVITGVTPSYTITSITEAGIIATATVTAPLNACADSTSSCYTGVSEPQLAMSATIASNTVPGFNGTGLQIQKVGPCLQTEIACGSAISDILAVTNSTTTVTDTNAQFVSTMCTGGSGCTGSSNAAITLVNQNNATQTCTGTVATYVSATQITVGGGCAGLNWTSSANLIIVAQALTNEQFQYVLTATGLGTGTGGTMTQTGEVPGGETYNGPQYALVTGTNTFQYYLPYTGLGTVASTGTAKLTTVGLSMGNANPNDPNYTYITHFNTYDVASINFGLCAGFLEQNAQHYGFFCDRDYDGIFNEATNENIGASNELTFIGSEHAASGSPGPGGAKFDIDFRGYGGGNIFMNPNLEYPQPNCPTCAGIILGNQQESKVISPFTEMGPSFTGEGIAITGRVSTVQIEGGQITGGETTGLHAYVGSNIAIKDVQITGNLQLDNQVNCPSLINNTQASLINNSTTNGCTVGAQTLPPTALACGGTISNSFNATQKARCTINAGSSLSFPLVTGANQYWDTLELNSIGTLRCDFFWQEPASGTGGTTTLYDQATSPGQSLACSAVGSNPGTLNLSISGANLVITNNTAANTTLMITDNNGVP